MRKTLLVVIALMLTQYTLADVAKAIQEAEPAQTQATQSSPPPVQSETDEPADTVQVQVVTTPTIQVQSRPRPTATTAAGVQVERRPAQTAARQVTSSTSATITINNDEEEVANAPQAQVVRVRLLPRFEGEVQAPQATRACPCVTAADPNTSCDQPNCVRAPQPQVVASNPEPAETTATTWQAFTVTRGLHGIEVEVDDSQACFACQEDSEGTCVCPAVQATAANVLPYAAVPCEDAPCPQSSQSSNQVANLIPAQGTFQWSAEQRWRPHTQPEATYQWIPSDRTVEYRTVVVDGHPRVTRNITMVSPGTQPSAIHPPIQCQVPTANATTVVGACPSDNCPSCPNSTQEFTFGFTPATPAEYPVADLAVPANACPAGSCDVSASDCDCPSVVSPYAVTGTLAPPAYRSDGAYRDPARLPLATGYPLPPQAPVYALNPTYPSPSSGFDWHSEVATLVAENAELRTANEAMEGMIQMKIEHYEKLFDAHLEIAKLQAELEASRQLQEIYAETAQLMVHNARLEAALELQQEIATQQHRISPAATDQIERLSVRLNHAAAENAELRARLSELEAEIAKRSEVEEATEPTIR